MYGLKIAGTDHVSFGPVPVPSDGCQNYLEHCVKVHVHFLTVCIMQASNTASVCTHGISMIFFAYEQLSKLSKLFTKFTKAPLL